MTRIIRRLLRLLLPGSCPLSLLACVGTIGLWWASYRSAATLPSEVPRGGWLFVNRRGQLALAHHKASPEPRGVTQVEKFDSLRGTWGTTTTYLSHGTPELHALVKALVFNPAVPWNTQNHRPTDILSRPYIDVPVAEGCRLRNGGGFGLRVVYLPIAGVPARYLPLWKRIGSVFQSAAVPHWFMVFLTAVPPARWLSLRRRRARARRVRLGRCAGCAYDLTGNVSGVCPECGASVADGAAR